MPIEIKIKDDEVESFIEFYGKKLNDIREDRKKLEQKEREYENILSQLSNKQNNSTWSSVLRSELNGYDPNWALHQKITYVLEKKRIPLTTRQIIDELYKIEPSLQADRLRFEKNISTIISIAIKSGDRFSRIEEPGKEYTYKVK